MELEITLMLDGWVSTPTHLLYSASVLTVECRVEQTTLPAPVTILNASSGLAGGKWIFSIVR